MRLYSLLSRKMFATEVEQDDVDDVTGTLSFVSAVMVFTLSFAFSSSGFALFALTSLLLLFVHVAHFQALFISHASSELPHFFSLRFWHSVKTKKSNNLGYLNKLNTYNISKAVFIP